MPKHTPMQDIDWYGLYSKKTRGKMQFDKKYFSKLRQVEAPLIALAKAFVPIGATICDAGAGLGRASLLLSAEGYAMTAVDSDLRMLETARKNVSSHGGSAKFVHGDLTELPFSKNSFDAIVHQGILEHFSDVEAVQILRHHLNIAPIVIFSVPIRSGHTAQYFANDGVERNLKSAVEWKLLLKNFKVLETQVSKQRSENLLVVVGR